MHIYIHETISYAIKEAEYYTHKLKSMSEHHAGAELIRLFVNDMLGRNTPQSKLFNIKYGHDFKKLRIVTPEIKLIAFIGLCILNIFAFLICLSYGNNKGYKWQKGWALVCLIKSIIDICLKRFVESSVILFGIPSLIYDEIEIIRNYLHEASNRLLKDKAHYRLHEFSATDYTFISSIVAKRLPYLVESKIILMYRDPLPERIIL